jgi:DNA-directed RNA polymerase subunit H (RpoH/RPB5)
MYVVFNKESKKIIGMSPVKPPESENNHIEHLENFDFENDRVVGDLENYKIVSKSEAAAILKENDLKISCGLKVQEKYPIHEQLNIIMQEIKKIKKESELSEEFNEMFNYISTVRQGFIERKQNSIENQYVIFINNEGNELGTHLDLENSLTREELLNLENIVYDMENEKIFNATQHSYSQYKQSLLINEKNKSQEEE